MDRIKIVDEYGVAYTLCSGHIVELNDGTEGRFIYDYYISSWIFLSDNPNYNGYSIKDKKGYEYSFSVSTSHLSIYIKSIPGVYYKKQSNDEPQIKIKNEMGKYDYLKEDAEKFNNSSKVTDIDLDMLDQIADEYEKHKSSQRTTKIVSEDLPQATDINFPIVSRRTGFVPINWKGKISQI